MMISGDDVLEKMKAHGLDPASVSPQDFQEGYDEESQEHPEFSEDQICSIVSDHLKEDPQYYSESTEASEGEDNAQEESQESFNPMTYRSDHANSVRQSLLKKFNLKEAEKED
jgi:hypothetical protein